MIIHDYNNGDNSKVIIMMMKKMMGWESKGIMENMYGSTRNGMGIVWKISMEYGSFYKYIHTIYSMDIFH